MNKKPKRILAVASGGGHWVQLCRMIPAWDGCAVTYVTTVPGYQAAMSAMAAERGQPNPGFHVVQEANRNQKFRLMKTLLQITLIVLRVWPDVIITTGAAPGGFALSIGKLLRRRTVWVDSIANSEELSASGKSAEPFSDLWLTQWEHIAKPDGPEFRGAVL